MPGAELDSYYSALQARYVLRSNPDYEQLVVPTGNASAPIHRWFHVKEAYSHALLARVLKDRLPAARELNLYDPFAGSGTTLVSAADLVADGALDRVSVAGVEVNPFLHLLSAVKLRGAAGGDLRGTVRVAQRVAARVAAGAVPRPELPALSTFRNEQYFERRSIDALLAIRDAVIDECGEDSELRDSALVCAAAAVEPCSGLRRDGRALRFAPEKRRAEPIQAFLDRAFVMAEDTRPQLDVVGSIVRGDARAAKPGEAGSADLVVFSPPYPNNIDYTEVYKLESWFLGFMADANAFAAQRHRTLRSHPSVKFAESYPRAKEPEIASLLAPILAAVPGNSRYAAARRRLLLGYADDMAAVLESCRDALKPGGSLVYVVGNSLHGNRDADHLLIASDLLIAELARIVGLDVESIEVARVPSRRATRSPFLRESVVFARKPNRQGS